LPHQAKSNALAEIRMHSLRFWGEPLEQYRQSIEMLQDVMV
jgi:hypothetical protein